VHCLCMGHPIVGDYTYNPWHRDAVIRERGYQYEDMNVNDALTFTSKSNIHGDGVCKKTMVLSADRMMLHAYQLR